MSRRIENLESERGTTLVELLVAISAGVVVMAALSTMIIVVLHGTARVSARVDATQKGRIAVTRIVEQLHSGCIAPQVAPVLEGSTGTTLKFIHSVGTEGAAVAPIATKSELIYSSTTKKLTQTDATAAAAWPNQVWGTAKTTTLLTNAAPIPPSSSIFTYFGSTSTGTVGEIIPGSKGLELSQAQGVIEVKVAFNASPSSSPIKDAGSATSIKDSAFLRLTPPSFNEKATAPPCQ